MTTAHLFLDKIPRDPPPAFPEPHAHAERAELTQNSRQKQQSENSVFILLFRPECQQMGARGSGADAHNYGNRAAGHRVEIIP